MLVVVTNRKLCEEPLAKRLGKIAPARPGLVVLREPDLDDAQYCTLADECHAVLAPFGIPLVTHSRPHTASDWIWLPFSQRQLPGKRKIVSVHSVEEAAAVDDAEYVVAGNVFGTPCKPGAPARGLDFLRGMVRTLPRKVLAIGGITPENARSCVDAGAAGLCVMTSAMTDPDPAGLIMRIMEACK